MEHSSRGSKPYLIFKIMLSHNVDQWFGFKKLLRYNAARWDAGMIELKSSCRIQFIRDPEKRTPYVVEMCFNTSWLDATAENDAKGRTNREAQTAVSVVMNGFDHANNPLQDV